jgi:hypothetical protein
MNQAPTNELIKNPCKSVAGKLWGIIGTVIHDALRHPETNEIIGRRKQTNPPRLLRSHPSAGGEFVL